MLNITLNDKKIQAEEGKTILDVAKSNGIEIPTLCHDENLKPYSSCWVCAVKVTGRRGFVTSCATQITEGMEIFTDTPEVLNVRKMALELLLSDHYADCESPCKLACPAHVDVQTYVAAIKNGQDHEAIKIIKANLPMPLSIGRVCPAFCEKECRRTLVEEPISIRQLKRYAADKDMDSKDQYIPTKEPAKHKKVAIIGAGPSGLTCGYYLSLKGYDVDIFEESPHAGGWLRYGIPEYRLPKEILDKEIKFMCQFGMKIHTEKTLGKDVYLSKLSKDYDAVYVAIGASKAVDMPLSGSNLPGIYLGVDYLKSVVLGKNPPKTGKTTAVIGGGNTAIDCARTALRLGSDVTVIYRRTRQEMPAEALEIKAAEEEGVKFTMLTNPVEYKGDGHVQEVVVEIMQLGEPDASGRRKPVGTGKFETYKFDTVIAAISQIPEVETFKLDENKINNQPLPITKWSTAQADENTMFTNTANIFAGGDFRRGPATAIEAIADGHTAADNIDKFLQGLPLSKPEFIFSSKKEKSLKKIDPKIFAIYEKINRVHAAETDKTERAKNFNEVELCYKAEQAKKEATRCLECNCSVNDTCHLRKFATKYEVSIEAFTGDKNIHPIDDTHPHIRRDENKCIKCSRCVRICHEIHGLGVLGFIHRGFGVTIAPEFGGSLNDTTCDNCGKCIDACPTGGLTKKKA